MALGKHERAHREVIRLMGLPCGNATERHRRIGRAIARLNLLGTSRTDRPGYERLLGHNARWLRARRGATMRGRR